jgi:hypothetical protein
VSDRLDPQDEATLEALGRALPRVAPAAGLFERILESTTPATQPPLVRPAARRSRRRSWLPVIAAAAAGAAAAALISVEAQHSNSLGTAAASAAVTGRSAVAGEAQLYGPRSPGGEIRLDLRDVPAPPGGAHYELWLLPRGSGQMMAVASFTPAGSRVDLVLPIPAPDDYAALEISVQPNNGPPTRSHQSLAGGSFSAPR